VASGPRAAIAWAPAARGRPSPRSSDQLRATGVLGWSEHALGWARAGVDVFSRFFCFGVWGQGLRTCLSFNYSLYPKISTLLLKKISALLGFE